MDLKAADVHLKAADMHLKAADVHLVHLRPGGADTADVDGREEAAKVAPAHPEGACLVAVGLQLPS